MFLAMKNCFHFCEFHKIFFRAFFDFVRIFSDLSFSNFSVDELPRGIVGIVESLENIRVKEGLNVLDADGSRLVNQVALVDLHQLLATAIPVSHVGSRLLGQIVEQMQQQLIVVLLETEVALKSSFHGLGDTVLLGGHESLQGDTDRHVDVVFGGKLTQMHLGVGLSHPKHRLYVTHGDGHAARGHGLATQLAVHLGHLLLVHLVQLGVDLLPGVENILAQQVLWNLLDVGVAGGVGQGRLRGCHVVHVRLVGSGMRTPV